MVERLQDLLEEFKLRSVYWALCIFSVTYFLTHTSKSMWMNVPIAVLFVSVLRILFNEVEFHWKVRKFRQQTYLSLLERKQLSVNDSRLSTAPPPSKWKRKIDSPIVEAAMEEFINKVLKDFVTDLWYADITPDKEAPELMRAVIMDVLGEISGRVKDINLVDLLTRDVVDLVGDHLDVFRRNQAAIGVDVMKTLSSKERDERLKHHLLASKELHPALESPESEYKVLQRLVGGLLAVVLRPREAQCPLVRCIARELVTCLVMQPIMNFASPMYVNELIEYIFLAINVDGTKEAGNSVGKKVPKIDFSLEKSTSTYSEGSDLMVSRSEIRKDAPLDGTGTSHSKIFGDDFVQARPNEWARILEAATQRRTEVLMPENLENMWARGRHYQKKIQKIAATSSLAPVAKGSVVNSVEPLKKPRKEVSTNKAVNVLAIGDKETQSSSWKETMGHLSHGSDRESNVGVAPLINVVEDATSFHAAGRKSGLKRSNSTSALKVEPNMDPEFSSEHDGHIISEFYSPDFGKNKNVQTVKNVSNMVYCSEGAYAPKLRCRVIGAYFEKLGSKSFAVYSIAVADADTKTWFVKRRYSNFERLHRHLKDIPNYTLHLPPKRIFSSSTEDAFVHQRCIQLDKYLQDLLAIANVAEQHEVWDFLSTSSKNYSSGKSSSVMRTLAVNVDDAMDDIVRQFKGVSDGLIRKVSGSVPSPSPYEGPSSTVTRDLSWSTDEIGRHLSWHSGDSTKSTSDNEDGDKDGILFHEEEESSVQANKGWHSDNEMNSKDLPPRVIKRGEKCRILDFENNPSLGSEPLAASFPLPLVDPVGVPPEWTPPNLSVPVLNLVDNIFQLKRRGWLRRQVFWISKQILQLMMEDAIDDWLLRQIQLLRREDIIAYGIRWVEDVLWPNGIFFARASIPSEVDDLQPNQRSSQTIGRSGKPASFEEQLEAARRASDVKKMLFKGAPSTLVSLIGHKQYRRCARDMYYFTQSTICLKQLAYGILELILVSVFPELRDLVLDVHKKRLS